MYMYTVCTKEVNATKDGWFKYSIYARYLLRLSQLMYSFADTSNLSSSETKEATCTYMYMYLVFFESYQQFKMTKY